MADYSGGFGNIAQQPTKDEQGSWQDGEWVPAPRARPLPGPDMGNYVDGEWDPYAPAPPKAPPNQLDIQRKKMMADAADFRKGLGGYKDKQFGSVADKGREQLDSSLKTIKHAANQRGMLYSGMRAGAEGGTRASLASMLAAQRAEINSEAEQLAGRKEEAAANVGLAGYGDAIKRAEDAYSLNQQNTARRNAALGQIGSGVGYGLGTLKSRAAPKIQGPQNAPVGNDYNYDPDYGSIA